MNDSRRRQVITVGSDGSLQGLQHKPGQGLDLRQFGAAKIERASEVVWHEGEQAWVVEFRAGAGSLNGNILDEHDVMAAGLDVMNPGFKSIRGAWTPFGRTQGEDPAVLLFADYDEAVKAEVAVLDGLRANGIY